jgi:DNA-binding transcriptional LysR family regulator
VDIRFLESFVAVVDCGSIAEAARRLNITAAALAQRLDRLEQDIGHPLVARVGRVVRPTASGLAIVEAARALLERAQDLRAIAAEDQPAGLLRLGAMGTAMTGLLPPVLARLRARHPAIAYFVRPGSSSDLWQATLAGELDAALIVRPPFALPKSIGWRALREEPLCLIAPIDLPGDDPHCLIAAHPFIRYDRRQWGGALVDAYLARHSLRVQDWLELDAPDAIAAMVSAGLGVAVLPDWAPPWPEGLRLRRLALRPGHARVCGVVWNAARARSAAIRAFVETCRDSAHQGANLGG